MDGGGAALLERSPFGGRGHGRSSDPVAEGGPGGRDRSVARRWTGEATGVTRYRWGSRSRRHGPQASVAYRGITAMREQIIRPTPTARRGPLRKVPALRRGPKEPPLLPGSDSSGWPGEVTTERSSGTQGCGRTPRALEVFRPPERAFGGHPRELAGPQGAWGPSRVRGRDLRWRAEASDPLKIASSRFPGPTRPAQSDRGGRTPPRGPARRDSPLRR